MGNTQFAVDKMVDPFPYVIIALYGLCVLAILLCFYLLYHSRKGSRIVNQRRILTNMLVTEFIFSCVQIKIYLAGILQMPNNPSYFRFELFVRIAIALSYIFTMHHISIDRLLEVYLHLSYVRLVTTQKTVYIIVLNWIMSLSFAAGVLAIMDRVYSVEDVLKFLFFFFFAADVSFLVDALFTYTYLYTKFRHFRQLSRRNSIASCADNSFKSPKFILPSLIVLSYLMFDTTASFLSVSIHFTGTPHPILVRRIGVLLFCFGFLSDSFIYIFLQRPVRRVLRNKLYFITKHFSKGKGRSRRFTETSFESKCSRVIPNIVVSSPEKMKETIIQNNHAQNFKEFASFTVPTYINSMQPSHGNNNNSNNNTHAQFVHTNNMADKKVRDNNTDSVEINEHIIVNNTALERLAETSKDTTNGLTEERNGPVNTDDVIIHPDVVRERCGGEHNDSFADIIKKEQNTRMETDDDVPEKVKETVDKLIENAVHILTS